MYACLKEPTSKPTQQTGSSLPGNLVIWREKIKKYIQETIPHCRELCPVGGKFCPACREKNIFFQACPLNVYCQMCIAAYLHRQIHFVMRSTMPIEGNPNIMMPGKSGELENLIPRKCCHLKGNLL